MRKSIVSYTTGLVAALALAGCGGGTSAPSTVTVYATPSSATIPTPSYKIVAKRTDIRPDGGDVDYVVIAPVDLSRVKQDVKLVLQAIAKTNGGPYFGAKVYDDEAVANTAYSLDRENFVRDGTVPEQRHLVAMYTGNTYGPEWGNLPPHYEISWFPAAKEDDPDRFKLNRTENWKP
jgi:hypothetical protein